MITKANKLVTEYFRNHKWKETEDIEGNIVFYKNREPVEKESYDFLNYSKQKKVLKSSDITLSLNNIFLKKGYSQTQIDEIVRNKDSRTFFISSGIQYFEQQFLAGHVPVSKPLLFIQPVIRTNYRKGVGEGYVSSFVNVSTVRLQCTPMEFLDDLDSWINFLSSLGLFMGDTNFKLEEKNPDLNAPNPWDRNSGFFLTCSYGGLQLGDAGYYNIPNQEDKPFEDIGFGLERLLWACNKNPSFKEVVGVYPYTFSEDMVSIDTLRTLSLMACAGINEEGDAYNQFIKYLSQLDFSKENSIMQIEIYYDYWSQFLTPKRDRKETSSYIETRLNELRNTRLLKQLGYLKIPKPLVNVIYRNTDYFIKAIIDLNPQDLSRIRDIYKKQ